jgi:hypothetical protein
MDRHRSGRIIAPAVTRFLLTNDEESIPAVAIPRFTDEEDLSVGPVEAEDAAGGEEPIDPEVLGEHPNDAAMNEEQMASGLETIDEASYPVVKLDVGLAARHGESSEVSEDLTMVGVGLLVGAALDIAEVALSQANVAMWLTPGQTRGLDRPLEVRRPHAGEFPAVKHRAQIGGLATADGG